MIQQKDLIVIPLYNEEATVVSVIKSIRKYYTDDILIVDDGSSDASIELIKGSDFSQIIFYHHKMNLGYGKSLIDGFNFASDNEYTRMITMDADGQHKACWISEFLNALDHADVVSGSRYMKSSPGNTGAPIDRMKINRDLTSIINNITGWELTDSFCGFKAYRVSAIKKLNLSQSGYAFPLQFWVQALYNKLNIIEIPVERVYLDLNRSFGNDLDDPRKRWNHYMSILSHELKQCGYNLDELLENADFDSGRSISLQDAKQV